MKETKVFYTENFRKLSEDPKIKSVGFSMESAGNLGKEEKGYYFLITAEETFFDECEVLKSEDVKEITGEEKEEIIKKFKELEEKRVEGFGALGI